MLDKYNYRELSRQLKLKEDNLKAKNDFVESKEKEAIL